MKPLVVLLAGPPVGLVLGAAVGAVICWVYAWRSERLMERSGL